MHDIKLTMHLPDFKSEQAIEIAEKVARITGNDELADGLQIALEFTKDHEKAGQKLMGELMSDKLTSA